jgi:hypothetical protein
LSKSLTRVWTGAASGQNPLQFYEPLGSSALQMNSTSVHGAESAILPHTQAWNIEKAKDEHISFSTGKLRIGLPAILPAGARKGRQNCNRRCPREACRRCSKQEQQEPALRLCAQAPHNDRVAQFLQRRNGMLPDLSRGPAH